MKQVARVALVAFLASISLASAAQQPDPESPRYKGVVALAEFVASEGEEALDAFLEARIAPALRASLGDGAVRSFLGALREEMAGAEMRGGRPIDRLAAEVLFNLPDGGSASIEFELSADDSDRFVYIASPNRTLEG